MLKLRHGPGFHGNHLAPNWEYSHWGRACRRRKPKTREQQPQTGCQSPRYLMGLSCGGSVWACFQRNHWRNWRQSHQGLKNTPTWEVGNITAKFGDLGVWKIIFGKSYSVLPPNALNPLLEPLCRLLPSSVSSRVYSRPQDPLRMYASAGWL